MRDYPAQLPGESDKSYAHLMAWIDFEDRGDRGATKTFAAARGIKPEQVRRLRSRYDWNARAAAVPTVDAAIAERTTELVVEQAAQSLAEKIAAAKERNAAVQAGLAAKLGQKLNEALERLDVTALDQAQLMQFITRGLREMTPGSGGHTTNVAVNQQQVHVELEEVAGLPPVQQARRVREIVSEADRQAALIAEYYEQHEAA